MNEVLETNKDETKSYASRYKWLYGVIFFSSILLFSRLWYLQIMIGQKLSDFSKKNRVKETKIPAPRGLLLDRQGRILVENLPGYIATITPQYATQLESTTEAIEKILDIPASKVLRMVKKGQRKSGPFRPVKIKENLNLTEVHQLRILRYDHPGLDIKKAILRHYPLKENGAQLFGYVGEISKREIGRYEKKYPHMRFAQGDIVGKNGLEEVWEKEVRGQGGLDFVQVDARGRESHVVTHDFFDIKKIPPENGNNLILTIDKDIQAAAYKAMMLPHKGGDRIGSAIAINSKGEILAWVVVPSFDPNSFSTGISKETWSRLVNDPFHPLRNKIVQDPFSPGSTFKPIVALAALEEKVITESTLISAPGSFRFGGRVYHDHSRHGHGSISVLTALEKSSNVFFYKMGDLLRVDTMAKYARFLGLGIRTKMKISNQARGLIPTQAWKKKNRGEAWQPGENLSMAIGQGYVSITTLQLALAYSAIGLEGKMYEPYLIKKILNSKNKVLKEFHPVLLRDLTEAQPEGQFKGLKISKSTFKSVKEGMRRVSNGERGTARWFKVPGVEMAGKTGTIQIRSFSADQIYKSCYTRPIEQRHHAAFGSFAPVENPEITVAIHIEHGCAGSTSAAPVARDIIYAFMKKYHPERIENALKAKRLKRRQKLDSTPTVTPENTPLATDSSSNPSTLPVIEKPEIQTSSITPSNEN